MQREEAVREIRTQTPDAFLPKARKRGWICPICHNGEGKDGDGIVLNKKTSGNYKCFKCGFSGDIFDLIGEAFGLRLAVGIVLIVGAVVLTVLKATGSERKKCKN